MLNVGFISLFSVDLNVVSVSVCRPVILYSDQARMELSLIVHLECGGRIM